MILILLSLVSLTALAVWVISLDQFRTFTWFMAHLFVMNGLVGLIIYSILGFEYIAAGYKASIINREYNTNYTQLEVFYASKVINMVRELDRKRIELNGNIITGE